MPPTGAFTPAGAIGSKWTELGGTTGVLGAPSSAQKCDPVELCFQEFSGGVIYNAPTTGAHAVLFTSGRTGKDWKNGGGKNKFGFPISDEVCTTTGCSQRFSSGYDLTWSRAGGSYIVWTRGAIGLAVYNTYGGYAALGYPSSNETCGLVNAGCVQVFGQQRMLWSPATGAYAIRTNGAIGAAFTAAGAERNLGYPVTKEICSLTRNGCQQTYQRGAVVYSPANGAHLSRGAIRGSWASQGYQNGSLGYPTGNEVCGQKNAGCYQYYQGGVILFSPATGAHTVTGPIKTRYASLGWHTGYLGYPTANQICGQKNGGCYQYYQGGVILFSPATGAQPVRGAIKTKYSSLGWHTGYLGYPAAAEYCLNGQCVQRFQDGYIGWGAGVGLVNYARTECSTLNEGRSKYSSGGAPRVTLVIAAAYRQSNARILDCKKIADSYVTDWITNGTVGQSGFKRPGVPSGPTRYLYSPTGSYSVTEGFGLGNPGTSLPYRTLNPRSRWGGNPWTATYNTYFESSSWIGYDENMWYFATRAQHDYRQGAVLNYNRPPDSSIVQNNGFAIFLHENPVPTAGCVAMDEWHVVDWLQKTRSGDRIIMGVRADLFR